MDTIPEPSIQYREYWPNKQLRLIVAGYANPNRTQQFYNAYIPHNTNDKPALIFFHDNGNVASLHWRVQGQPNRKNPEDPTDIYYYEDPKGQICEKLYLNAVYWQNKRISYPPPNAIYINENKEKVFPINKKDEK